MIAGRLRDFKFLLFFITRGSRGWGWLGEMKALVPVAVAVYTRLTMYSVLHWSEYTCLLSLGDPFTEPMHKLPVV